MGEKRECTCPAVDHQHGTVNAYLCDRCRCPDCTWAVVRRWKEKEHLARHGRAHEYAWGDGAGTRRRVGALMINGWSIRRISALSGVHGSSLAKMMRSDSRVKPGTRRKIALLFDQLWDEEAPTDTPADRQSSTIARRVAAERGFAPALAWDDIDDPNETPYREAAEAIDEIAIERALAGREVELTKQERDEAIRICIDRGLSAGQISELLHVGRSTVRKAQSTPDEEEAA